MKSDNQNKKSKPSVAIARGPALSKWEMQIYEPLISSFNLRAIGSKNSVNDINRIKFPVKQLFCPGQFLTKLPKSVPLLFELAGDTQYLWGFDEAVKGCDVVHAVELRNYYSLQAVRAKKKGLVGAVTLTVYENIPYLFDNFQARKKIKQEVIAGTDHFLAINEAAREALIIEGVEEALISIVPQSVDTGEFRPAGKADYPSILKIRKKYQINQSDFLVLSVGRMVWEKGWFDIIPAAAYVKKHYGSKIKFLLVGEGKEKKRVKRLIKDADVSDIVNLTGVLPYSQMADVFRSADVFLYPSLPTPVWNAQFGGVLIEAMASGLPIVGTLSGGTRDDTVGADGGIFVQPQHFSGLADAIIRLYNRRELTRKIGQRNRKIAVEKYDTHVVAQKIKNIWLNVLNERNR